MAEAASWKKKKRKKKRRQRKNRAERRDRLPIFFLVNVFPAYHLLAFHTPPGSSSLVRCCFFLLLLFFWFHPFFSRCLAISGLMARAHSFRRDTFIVIPPPLNWIFWFYFQFYFARIIRGFFCRMFFIFCFIYLFFLLTWLLSLSSKDRIGFSSLVHVFIKFATQRWSGGDEIGGGRNVSKRIEKERVLVTKDWFKITRSCETRSLES